MKLLTLVIVGMLMFSSCSTTPTVVTKEIPILPPDSLLRSPCKPISAGTTGAETVKGYIENTYCINQYEAVLEANRKWKAAKQELYKKAENK